MIVLAVLLGMAIAIRLGLFGNGFWSTGCRSDVEWYGFPGQGSYYRWNGGPAWWVGGGIWAAFRDQGFECGLLGPPVGEYKWISEMNYGRGCFGQWFANGAIGYHDGAWRIMYGYYGQMGIRGLVRHPVVTVRSVFARQTLPGDDAEIPPDPPPAAPPLTDLAA